MFYTDVPYDEIKKVCADTLNAQHVAQPLQAVFAADRALSFNYTIWTNGNTVDKPIDRIVSFGDSLSDNGNLFNATDWIMPNRNSWFAGHFSNGQIWSEQLADLLGVPLYNWAVGGVGVDNEVKIQNISLPGMISQIHSWHKYMEKAQGYDISKTLFTVLIGANDIFATDLTTEQIVAKQSDGLRTLIKYGAKRILVVNLPDLSRIPFIQFAPQEVVVRMNRMPFKYRNAIHTALVDIRKQYPDVQIQEYDLYEKFNYILSNPALFNFKNIKDSCLVNDGGNFWSKMPVFQSCKNPNDFIFWDAVHPTSALHGIIAKDIFNDMQN